MKTDKRIHMKINNEQIDAACLSDMGYIRSKNEDCMWLDETGLVMLLADGMGGHERGDEASQSAIEVINKCLTPEEIKKAMEDITETRGVPSEIASLYTVISRAVREAAVFLSKRNRDLRLERYMGTTIIGLILSLEGYAIWFHIGDSRLYLWRDSSLKCLTNDHSAYEEWKNNGRVGFEPGKNIITRVIGNNPNVEAEIQWDERRKGDTFILCSDGLTDMILEEQMEYILRDEDDVGEVAKQLVNSALAGGGKDNISVIVCRVL